MEVFLGMRVVWTNILTLTNQIPAADDASTFVATNGEGYVFAYVAKIGAFLRTFKDLVEGFLALAEQCSSAFSQESADPFAQIRPTLQNILGMSQKASPDLGELFRVIAFEKGMTQVKRLMDSRPSVEGGAQEPTE
jgi:hypothetical protein